MLSQSISLRTQLLCTIVGSIIVTAAALTTMAYRAQIINLERDARRTVRVAAQSRAEAVVRLIDGQQQRAQRFLITATALCGEASPLGGIAWEQGCAQRALRELRASERATGVSLTNGVRRIARTGTALPDDLPIPSPLARLVEREGQRSYVILAENKDAALRLQFTLRDLSALFDQPVDLGPSGDVYLRDSAGIRLTPSRSDVAAAPAALGESSHSCASGPSESDLIDYPRVDTIHSVQSVWAFGQPMCVDAFVSHGEALAPAGALLVDLARRAALLTGVGAVLALIAAYWMTAPVQRLAVSARALERGDFARPIPTGGPSEIQALAHAFDGMAHALGEQMARAQLARHDAETANHAKDEFLAVLSHELRAPLTSTLGWAGLLRRGGLDSAMKDRAIASIERSTETQKRLIEDLLDVSSIITGRLRLDRTIVQLNDAVRVVLEELRPLAEEKAIVLESHFEAAPTVRADPLRLQQILSNLVANAIKFTGAGGRVLVRAREVDGYVEIVVADTGVGIPLEFLPHVFEPFRQADAGPRRAHGGLGLGLSIVRHLVKLHGGIIQATSMGPGFGASFEVRLPLASSDLVLVAHTRADQQSNNDSAPGFLDSPAA
jgi:signal transduction histidine kinase